jgi:thioredoxin-related protein
MSQWKNHLETAVNIAILGAFVMVAVLAGQRFWNSRAEARSNAPKIGTHVALAGVDWSKSNRNLVMALSTTCHFCSESAEFYKRLLEDVLSKKIPALAVLPQSTDASSKYLADLGVPIPELHQSSLEALDVSGTPTLLIVDNQGKIRQAWVGKLPPDLETQVIAAFR